MKMRGNKSDRASALQVALLTGLISIPAILLAIATPTNREKAPQQVSATLRNHTDNGTAAMVLPFPVTLSGNTYMASQPPSALRNHPDTSVSLSGNTPAAPALPAVMIATTCPTLITQSSTQTITAGNSISCNNGVSHTDNSYWRAFDMSFLGTGFYAVDSVSFGVEWANNTQPVTVRLYAN